MALVHRNRWLHDISVDDRIEFPIVLSRLLNAYIHQFLHFRFHLFSYMPLYEAHLLFRICLFCIYFDFVLGNSKKIRLQCFWLPSLNHHRLTLIVRMNPVPSLRGGRKGEWGVGGLNPYDWYSDYFMENACERFIRTGEFSYTYQRVLDAETFSSCGICWTNLFRTNGATKSLKMVYNLYWNLTLAVPCSKINNQVFNRTNTANFPSATFQSTCFFFFK